jgi:Endodeoxyribonuclease RusA
MDDIRDYLDPKTETVLPLSFDLRDPNVERLLECLSLNHPKGSLKGVDAQVFSVGACPRSYQGEEAKWYHEQLTKKASSLKNIEDFKRKAEGKEVVVGVLLFLGNSYRTIDVDNVAKNVLDGLKTILFDDDAQVKKLIVEKELVEKGKYRQLYEMVYIGIAII